MGVSSAGSDTNISYLTQQPETEPTEPIVEQPSAYYRPVHNNNSITLNIPSKNSQNIDNPAIQDRSIKCCPLDIILHILYLCGSYPTLPEDTIDFIERTYTNELSKTLLLKYANDEQRYEIVQNHKGYFTCNFVFPPEAQSKLPYTNLISEDNSLWKNIMRSDKVPTGLQAALRENAKQNGLVAIRITPGYPKELPSHSHISDDIDCSDTNFDHSIDTIPLISRS